MMPLKNLYRHYSSLAMWAALSLGGAQEMLPAVKEFLPPWVSSAIIVCGLIGKLIPQDKKGEK